MTRMVRPRRLEAADDVLDRPGLGDAEAGGRLVHEDELGAQAPARAIATICRCPPESASTGSSIGGTLAIDCFSISPVPSSMARLSRTCMKRGPWVQLAPR